MCVCHQDRVKQLPVLLILSHTLSAALSFCHTGPDLEPAYWLHSVAGLFGVKCRPRLSLMLFSRTFNFQVSVSTGFI